MAGGIDSIHALVRLLKSSIDPPSTLGPAKIETACLAWSDPSFIAANKGEVIGEWILTLLGQAKKTRREKNANSTSDFIADSRYWTLLSDVLTASHTTAARPTKAWVLPLLNRFQLDASIVELLTHRPPQVLAPARAALSVLWPLAEKKVGIDALGECLRAVLDACAEWERVDEDLCWICSVIVDAYKNAFANAGNKKKLYNSFLTIHLSSWLSVMHSSRSLSCVRQLQDNIRTAGTDILFSLDALKQPLDTLFDAFSSSMSLSLSLLPILPKLLTAFLSATHRHRSTLFVTATSAIGGKEEVRKRGMEFVGRCWALTQGSASPQRDFDLEKWKSIIGIFEIVAKERLFVPSSLHGHIDAAHDKFGGELALSEARDKAIEMLETEVAPSQEQVVLSTQLLGVLVQIEYDFVGSILGRVLSASINISPSLLSLAITPFSEFLTHVLEYHIKTRTVHAYALALLDAVVASTASATSLTSSSLSMTRSFPLAYHLPPLAHAIRTSLTPTQITPLATAALHAVDNAWKVLKNVRPKEGRVAKKRMASEGADKSEREARLVLAQAEAFTYTCRVAGMILSNLPANAYTNEGEYSLEHLWCDVGKLGWTVIWDCLGEKITHGEEHDTVKSKNGKKRKHIIETGPYFVLYPQIVTAAALRFLYDIRARVSFLLGDRDELGAVDVRTLLNVARDKASDPELVFEMIRTFFWHMWYIHSCESEKRIDTQPIFIVVLDILTSHLLPESQWSGVSAALTRDNLALAVLYVLTDRWIDVFDALASTENLEKLIPVLFSVSLDLYDGDTGENSDETRPQCDRVVITLRGILLNLLRNAQFWELHNIRAVFLSFVLSLTACLSSSCSPTIEVESPPPTTAAETELTLACDAYTLLLYVPFEYLSRPVRAELVKRAIVGDVQICRVLESANGGRCQKNKDNIHLEVTLDDGEESKDWFRRLTSVRVFLQRMRQFLNTPNHTTSLAFVNHLLSFPSCIYSLSEALTNVTPDLIQSHVVSLLRSQEPEADASASSVISTLVAARPFSHPNSQETWTHIIAQSSVLKLIERLTSGFDSASLSVRVKHSLKTLVEALESALLSHAQRSRESNATELEQFPSSERINAWSRMMSLTRWLGMNPQVASISLGLKLATSTIRGNNFARLDPETCSSVLGLLFEELLCMPDISHRVHLDVLVGFYAVNGGDRGTDVEHTMDAHVAQASKKLSVQDFSRSLDVLAEAIGGSGLRAGQRERLIRLGRVMLHDAPQGTLKVIQAFVTRCLDLFVDGEFYGAPSHMKLCCLEFIARHCSDRPAAIRSIDLGSVWPLLHRMLSGSPEHDATTVFSIFHHIVAVIGAFIRLRRDLVVHTLPHLSLVLCQLMMLTRKIRPQLGAKQTKIVTDTFPSWLSASQPLSSDDVRALARLLTSLTIKTVPRTHAYGTSTTTELSQKAESLAKPFSKHASYVLVAYVEAFSDPLCIVDAETRRELEPGLFALCGMVGEHSRDALMLSTLDSGGKTIMKSLWRDYEKQRYVGKD